MRIAVIGLGYVGSVSAACLARDGHSVIGADPNLVKVDAVNAGRAPVLEAGLDALVAEGVAAGCLRATDETPAAVAASELVLVCVGTPSRADGSLDLTSVAAVCEEIGAAIGAAETRRTLVFRSTVLPGTHREVILPKLEAASGKRAGGDFGLVHNPEFLREGQALRDYDNPPRTVIGELDAESGAPVAALYGGLDAPLVRCPLETAEIVKYADNAWHALKVAFGNEIGSLCKALAIDSHAVMEIFCQDRKLNISPHYLRPGFAFGGSCLPKDLRALNAKARDLALELPLLGSIMPSNERQLARGLELIVAKGRRRIGLLGLSFKAGTDDLRESPLARLAAELLARGLDLRAFDPSLEPARLTGANRDFVRQVLPDIESLLVADLEALLGHAEVVVVGTADPAFAGLGARLSPAHVVVDLVRLEGAACGAGGYDGINW